MNNKTSYLWIFTLIVMIGSLTQIATDLYTPSLPAIAHFFHVRIGLSQLTLTVFMAGVAVTNLIYGPLSEGIGRRKAILIGLSIATVGAFISLSAHNIHTLLLGRLIQGIGCGSCALWRSIFRDTFTGDDLSKYGSYLGNIIIFTVVAAPFLGGYFQALAGWRLAFGFLTVYSFIIILFVIFGFKETHTSQDFSKLKPSFMLKAYGELLTHRTFMGICLAVFLSYGGMFAWVTVGPALLIHHLGVSPIFYGYLSIIAAAAMFFAGLFNGKVVKKYGANKMLNIGWLIMFIGGLSLLAQIAFISANVTSIMVSVFIFIFGATLIWPNAVANAFTPFGHIAGTAAALYAFLQLLGAAVFSLVLAHLPDTRLSLAVAFIASAVLAYAVNLISNRTGSQ